MTTTHEQAAEDLLADFLADPDGQDLLVRVTHSLHDSSPTADEFRAIIGQTQRQAKYWPQTQIAAFTHVVNQLANGNYAKRRIKVGHAPGPDADRDANAARLRDLRAPFIAELDMHQNGADSDGTLHWGENATLWRATGVPILGAHVLHGTIHAPFEVRPFTAPLEVGYTHPSRTMAHLLVEGAVARWPYDDDEITLIVNLERLGPFIGARPLPSCIEPSGAFGL